MFGDRWDDIDYFWNELGRGVGNRGDCNVKVLVNMVDDLYTVTYGTTHLILDTGGSGSDKNVLYVGNPVVVVREEREGRRC